MNMLVVAAILLGVTSAILETEPVLVQRWGSTFDIIGQSVTLLFAVEYLARLWSAAERPGPGTATAKRLRFVFSIAGLLDLVVIGSAWAPLVAPNLAILRFARIARLLLLAKLGGFSRAAQHLHFAVASRRYELMLALSLALILLILGASALYWVEGGVQPDKFGSIPRALWWAAITLTTIGYGDVSPITPLGKAIATLVAIAGIGLVALPTGILAAGFSEAVQRDRQNDR